MDLPRELDPQDWLETGAQVIEHGPPVLPAALNHQMSIPIGYWSAHCCAVVTFMQFRRDPLDGHVWAGTCTVLYARQHTRWVPPLRRAYSCRSYALDPVTDPTFGADLDGNAMTYGSVLQRDHEPGSPPIRHWATSHLRAATWLSSRTATRNTGPPVPLWRLGGMHRATRQLRRRRIRRPRPAAELPGAPVPVATAPTA